MGWHSITKSIRKAVKDYGNYGLGLNYAKDFKNWYDGTDAQRKAAELQQMYNLENWNLQNEYNTPEAQMARFKAAGLNPNLAYTQSSTASDVGRVNVGSAMSGGETMSKAAQTIMSFYNIASLIASVKNMQAQNKNLGQQNLNLQASQGLSQSQASFIDAQTERYKYETEWLRTHGTSSFDSPTLRAGKSMLSSSPSFYFNTVDKLADVFNEVGRSPSKGSRDRATLDYVKKYARDLLDVVNNPVSGATKAYSKYYGKQTKNAIKNYVNSTGVARLLRYLLTK